MNFSREGEHEPEAWHWNAITVQTAGTSYSTGPSAGGPTAPRTGFLPTCGDDFPYRPGFTPASIASRSAPTSVPRGFPAVPGVRYLLAAVSQGRTPNVPLSCSRRARDPRALWCGRSFPQALTPCHLDHDAAGRCESSSVCDRHLELVAARTYERGRRVLGLVRSVALNVTPVGPEHDQVYVRSGLPSIVRCQHT